MRRQKIFVFDMTFDIFKLLQLKIFDQQYECHFLSKNRIVGL